MTTETLVVAITLVAVCLLATAVVLKLYFYNKLNLHAQQAVSAAYRVAIKLAEGMCEEAGLWLRSEEGKAFRKRIADAAYDALPATIGPVPVGLVKLYVSRETFNTLVQRAFDKMAVLSDQLEEELYF